MGASEGFIELLRELLTDIGPLGVRRMFGGAGLFADGLMFGIVIDDVLYLKADDTTRGDFEAEGLAPFSYQRNGRAVDLSYWRSPERLLDDADEMHAWAQQALDVAKRASAKTPRKGKKRGKTS
ncbi:DNA transformation protein and related proteins [Hyphomicrobium sp. 1Nfss2.1]|uniref:TfoX/Sxy family protein n=1 Tax=Hyphomicrobium sp. 1Nfss2.1 TaxID=3413936 RepID=UPI003C79FB01